MPTTPLQRKLATLDAIRGSVAEVFQHWERETLMPNAVLHYCGADRCGQMVRTPYCPAHTKSNQRHYDDRRGSASQRGYGAKWTAYRDQFRARYPLCGMRPVGAPTTADSQCEAEGRPEPMYVVDHIVPVQGAHDSRFYDETNMQSLCERCHNRKRQRESRER